MGDRHSWAESGAQEVAPGVYRLPLPMPGNALTAVNVYAIDDGEGIVLIDAGWDVPEAEFALTEALASIGRTIHDVHGVIVTHAHYDHYTLAVRLRREHGIPISIGAMERQSIEWLVSSEDRYGPNVEELHRAGAPELAHAVSAGILRGHASSGWQVADRWLPAGAVPDVGRQLVAQPTPGHTVGHIVLDLPDAGVTFTGDHLLPHITPSIGFEALPRRHALTDYLNSLKSSRAAPDRLMLPAHGYVLQSVRARADQLLVHHDRRLAATLDGIELLGGRGSAASVAEQLTWTRHNRHYREFPDFHRVLAVIETVAHLEHLAAEGMLSIEADSGTGVRYLAR